jgi:hypothetical protein
MTQRPPRGGRHVGPPNPTDRVVAAWRDAPLSALVELASRLEAASCVLDNDLGQHEATKAAECEVLEQLRYCQWLLAGCFLTTAA